VLFCDRLVIAVVARTVQGEAREGLSTKGEQDMTSTTVTAPVTVSSAFVERGVSAAKCLAGERFTRLSAVVAEGRLSVPRLNSARPDGAGPAAHRPLGGPLTVKLELHVGARRVLADLAHVLGARARRVGADDRGTRIALAHVARLLPDAADVDPDTAREVAGWLTGMVAATARVLGLDAAGDDPSDVVASVRRAPTRVPPCATCGSHLRLQVGWEGAPAPRVVCPRCGATYALGDAVPDELPADLADRAVTAAEASRILRVPLATVAGWVAVLTPVDVAATRRGARPTYRLSALEAMAERRVRILALRAPEAVAA
jgi:hypothetical protein